MNDKNTKNNQNEFAFSLVLCTDKNSNFKINMIIDDYDFLKQWIVGLNCLITNRD